MAANAIKWIARRAKQLKRSRPNKHRKYSGYIQDASAEYRRKSKPRKKSTARKKSPARKSKKRAPMRRKKISGAVGSLTAVQHVARAKDLIAQKIAALELRKFTSRTKTEKRKYSRAISELKRTYSKLKT